MNFTIPNGTSNLVWGGYTYDSRDTYNDMDVVQLSVSELKNPATIPSELAARLYRTWDTVLGPMTTADYAAILAADPFANGGAPIDPGRFQQVTGQTPINYAPAPAGQNPSTDARSIAYQTATSLAVATTDTYEVSNSVTTKFSVFGGAISSQFKYTNTLTLTNKYSLTE